MSVRQAVVLGLAVALLALVYTPAAPAAQGTWDRAWGEDVDSVAAGVGFEVCTVAANCKTGEDTPLALGGEIDGAFGIATDAAGNVYVADGAHHRVQKFSPTGVFERAWGEDVVSSGPGNTGVGFEICVAASGDVCKIGATAGAALGGELAGPNDVAVDAAGNVYVSEGFQRVQRYSSSGVFERAWGGDVVSSGPGNTGTGFEVCVAANGDVCKTGVASAGLGGEFTAPAGLDTDSAGNVYVIDVGMDRLSKFSSSGAFERAWGEDVVSAGPGNTGVGFEVCVAARADVCKFGVSAGAALGGEFLGPSGVAVDGAGNVYIGDTQHHRVQKFSSLGVFERAWGEDVVNGGGTGFEVCVAANADICKIGVVSGAAVGGDFNFPQGPDTDAAGNVYVADTFHRRIQRFSPLGAFERTWGEDVASAGPGNTGTGFEICVAASGDVCKTGVSPAPALGGEFASPGGLAISPAGDLYVVDTTHDRIERFVDPPVIAPPGTPPATPPAKKKCKKGQKLRKGKCVKKKRKK